MFVDPEKIKRDILQMEKLSGSGSKFNFCYLNKDTTYIGMIIIPTDEAGNDIDFYHIDNVHRFGKNYIPQNEHNDEIISTLEIGETVDSSRVLDGFGNTYSLVSNLKIGLIDPTDKKQPLKILSISYSSKISDFLSKFYELYNQVKDTIFNRILKIKMTDKGVIEIEVSEPKSFKWSSIVKEKYGEQQVSQISTNLGKLIKSSREFNTAELTTIVMKWKRGVDQALGSDSPQAPGDKVITSGWDSFVKERSESQNTQLVEEPIEDDSTIPETDNLDDIWGDFDTSATSGKPINGHERSPF